TRATSVLVRFYHCSIVRRLIFFCSSRRRHTISKRDWSSDVCSSDLEMVEAGKDFNVTPAIEPISYQGVRDLDAVEEIAKTGSFFLPDTLHLHRFGATPQQLGAVTAHIPMIQICGAEPQRPTNREGLVEESRGHRLAPNAGASDVVGYLRAVSPDIPVSVEAPNDIFVGQYGSRAWLEKLYQAGREVIASAAHS